MKLIIDRKRWGRGRFALSYLLSSKTGKMCCLGFCAKQCGASDKEIMDIGKPSMAPQVKWLPGMIETDFDYKESVFNTEIVLSLMTVNDTKIGQQIYKSSIIDSEETRESMIKELFSRLNVEVEFIN